MRTDTLAELFDVATLLASQPLPAGRRVAIVTNAGGPGIMCADACESLGLDVVPLRDEVEPSWPRSCPPQAALTNPVDMIATAPAEHYRRAVSVVGRHKAADAIIAIFIPPLLTEPARLRRDPGGHRRGRRTGAGAGRVHDRRGRPPDLSSEDGTIPAFAFPGGRGPGARARG